MNLFDQLIQYKERPRKDIKKSKVHNQLAALFNRLASAKRYVIKNGKKHPSSKTISKEMDVEMCRIFGTNWYQKELNSWTETNQLEWLKTFIQNNNLLAQDWYTITLDDFKQNDGLGLIDKYANSVKNILDKFGLILYPNYVFYEWKFMRVGNWELPYKPQYPTYYEQNTTKYELFKTKLVLGSILENHEIPLFRRFMDYIWEQEKFTSIYQFRDGLEKLLLDYGII
jgi:hypothetical protein